VLFPKKKGPGSVI